MKNSMKLYELKNKLKIQHVKLKFQFISSTGPIFNQIEKAVQYNYRLCKANRESTPIELYVFMLHVFKH